MKLDELGFVGRGKSKHRPRNDPSLYGGEYPFVQTGDVKEADLWLSHYTQTYSEAGLAQSKLWPVGTLCITIAANIAETAILKIPACFPDSIVGFIPHEGKADARFVKYYIDTIKLRMQNVSKGTTQDNLSVDKLLSFDFDLPDYSAQKRIASILCAYDDLIENNTRRVKILEEMAQMIYREWFVNFRFPQSQETVHMVSTDIGQAPKSWAISKLSNLVETQYGYTESAKQMPIGPKYLRGMDINKSSYIQWEIVPYCQIATEEIDSYKLHIGDILVIRMADPGKVGIVEKEEGAVFASYLIRLKIKEKRLTPYYLFHFLLSTKYQNYVSGASTGTTRKSASAGVMTDIDILIPPDKLMEKFEEVVGNIRTLLNTLLDQNSNLRRTRDFLLPQLISGEIDVAKLEPQIS
jgi:type I restriction enzyme, S subunit